MTIPLERRLISAELRLLVPRAARYETSQAENDRIDALLEVLADGETQLAAAAFMSFGCKLATEEPVAVALKDLWYEGQLDLVGIDAEKVELLWAGSQTEAPWAQP